MISDTQHNLLLNDNNSVYYIRKQPELQGLLSILLVCICVDVLKETEYNGKK